MTTEERYERALWELSIAQAEVRECERLMAVEYATGEMLDGQLGAD